MDFCSAIGSLPSKAVEQFNVDGYCVVDDALPPVSTQEYLEEVKKCWDSGCFSPNMVEFLTSSGPLQLKKPNIHECDLHDAKVRRSLPAFSKLFDEELPRLIDTLNRRFNVMDLLGGASASTEAEAEARASVENPPVARHLTLKLQINRGGCFPWHYDNPSPPNKRKLTLALYLTPDYDAARDGGEIVLMPFLRKPVRVAPKFNTLVLFRSDLINHRVLPMSPSKTRYCFTIWFDSGNVNPDSEVNLRAKHLVPESIPKIMNCPLQRAVSRAVYDKEYREALEDCFGTGTKEAVLSIRMHEAHLKPLLANPALMAFVAQLIERKEAIE